MTTNVYSTNRLLHNLKSISATQNHETFSSYFFLFYQKLSLHFLFICPNSLSRIGVIFANRQGNIRHDSDKYTNSEYTKN